MNEKRITIEVSEYDLELILKSLEERKQHNQVWGKTYNPNLGHDMYGYIDTKESRRCQSTINYIKKQLKE